MMTPQDFIIILDKVIEVKDEAIKLFNKTPDCGPLNHWYQKISFHKMKCLICGKTQTYV